MPKHIIFGSPGTGKTTKLISILKKLFDDGIKPEEVCFCTFTKAGAEEAKERIIEKFNLTKDDLLYFGTIHSICYKKFCLGMNVISQSQIKDFFNKIHLEYEITKDDEDLLTNEASFDFDGNILLNFYDKIRLSFCKSIYEINEDEMKVLYQNLPMPDGSFMKIFVNAFNPYKTLIEYEKYKKENNLIDFIDMLLICYKNKFLIPTKILIVDEFQDLSPLQYEIFKIWEKDKKDIYLAGDDDQTIYSFICANSKYLLEEKDKINENNGDEILILDTSYRLKSEINRYCHDFINKNLRKEKRVAKLVKSFSEGGEIINDYINYDLEKVLDYVNPEKWTFILFRTNYYKKAFINEILIKKGIVYHEIRGKSIWNDKTINLFNASIKLFNKQPINSIEVKYLLSSIPFKFGMFKKGLKSNYKNMTKLNEYNMVNLMELGFNMQFFNICKDYESLFSVIDLGEGIKKSFIERQKSIVSLPIRLKIGTIHSSKGKEADNVIIFKDISNKVAIEIRKDQKSWENEMRVFFVGQSRAREKLIILRGGFQRSESDLIP